MRQGIRSPRGPPIVLPHPLRHLLVLALALVVIACGGGGSGGDGDDPGLAGDAMRSVVVRWRAADDVAGYVIHWGRASGTYAEQRDVGDPTADADGVIEFFLEADGPPGTIFFALSSYDGVGNKSAFSNEIAVLLP